MKKILIPSIIVTMSLIICFSCKKENHPPVIVKIIATPQVIRTGDTTHLTCIATDPDGDNLFFLWSSLNGTFISGINGSSVLWKAPIKEGIYSISVIVNDQQFTAIDTVNVIVDVKPQLTVTPSLLDFGIYGTEKMFEIRNTEKGTLIWAISQYPEWLWLNKKFGETTTAIEKITATADRDGLLPGTYTNTITITSNGGNQNINVSIKVGETGRFTDNRDGNTYKWIKIGEQIWMAENLAYLPSVVPFAEKSRTEPLFYVYGYQGINVAEAKATENYKTYGVLYNWNASMIACPAGWHLPTDAEWKQLEMYLGMSQNDADKQGWRDSNVGVILKAINGWNSYVGTNGGGNDGVGFSGLPGGNCVYNTMDFKQIGSIGCWWSATENTNLYAWYRSLYNSSSDITRFTNEKETGFSVRCVKN